MAEGSGVNNTATGDVIICSEIKQTVARLNGQIKEAACLGIRVDFDTYNLATMGAPLTPVITVRTYKEI